MWTTSRQLRSIALLTLLWATAAHAETAAGTAQEIHNRALTLDAHADIELPEAPSRYASPDGTSRVAPDKMRTGRLDAVVMALAVGPGPRTEDGYAAAWATAQKELAAVRALAEADDVVIPLSPDDLLDAHAANQRALILGMQNGLILGQQPERVDQLFADGVRVFALTHMGHNDYADSSRPLYIMNPQPNTVAFRPSASRPCSVSMPSAASSTSRSSPARRPCRPLRPPRRR